MMSKPEQDLGLVGINQEDETSNLENGLDVNAARDHLNNAPENYYESINGREPEEYISFIHKLKPLTVFLPNPNRVVSVGVGRGLEVRALAEMYEQGDTEVVGLDLSRKAIDCAEDYLKQHGINARLIEGSGIDMPFVREDMEVNGLVLSAILHEIYSYLPDGKSAWKKAIQDTAHSLSEDGILLLRDFAAPYLRDNVSLSCLSVEAREFYQYFVSRYRTFEKWSPENRSSMMDKREGKDDYPTINDSNSLVRIPFEKVAEMMLHFRNYLDNVEREIIEPGDRSWKEIDECYLPPNPDLSGIQTMSPPEYVEKVIEVANESLEGTEFQLICVQSDVVGRPNTAELFSRHFGLQMEGVSDSKVLFDQIPNKMELVFKKVKRKV